MKTRAASKLSLNCTFGENALSVICGSERNRHARSLHDMLRCVRTDWIYCVNAAEQSRDEKNVPPRNKDAPVLEESRCVRDLAKLQDLGSLILLVLKVGISTKTREDQTAGRGIAVSTHDFLSSPPFIISTRSLHPLLTAVVFYLQQKKNFLISPSSSVCLCSSTRGANG